MSGGRPARDWIGCFIQFVFFAYVCTVWITICKEVMIYYGWLTVTGTAKDQDSNELHASDNDNHNNNNNDNNDNNDHKDNNSNGNNGNNKNNNSANERRDDQTQKCFGLLSLVQLVLISSTFIFLKELTSSINWIYWLVKERSDRGDVAQIFLTDFFFALSLFFMQVLFVKRLQLTLTDTSFQYPFFIYVLLYLNIGLIFIAAICVTCYESMGPFASLSSWFAVLCTFMIVNTLSVTFMFYRGLSKLVLQATGIAKEKGEHLLHALIRLTFVTLLALGSTTVVLITGLICFKTCNFCNATYVYYAVFPLDSMVNISSLLASARFGHPYYLKMCGRVHGYLFEKFNLTKQPLTASDEMQPR